ncbi:hypothetical protein BsWGS_28014 [Bradybaena similaris]
MFRSVMSRKFLISLVRHGETMENRQKIMQGQLDTKLSDLGSKQAQLLAMRLKNDRFTHMFSSDLARAADTARAIAEANKSFTAELILDRRLRERGFGNLEGKLLPEYKKAADKAKVPMQNYTPEGGETIEQVTARAKEFFEELCRLMAEPLLNAKSSCSMEQSTCRSDHDPSCSQQYLISAAQVWTQGEESREDESYQPLHIDTPNCFQLPEPLSNVTNSNHKNTDGSDTGITPGVNDVDAHASQQSSKNVPAANSVSHPNNIPDPSVLIVSHGLLLRELKRLILSRYSQKLEESHAKEAGIICPNTGLSQFGMCVYLDGGKVEAKCEKVFVINDTQHLLSSNEDLVSLAKFQGAL